MHSRHPFTKQYSTKRAIEDNRYRSIIRSKLSSWARMIRTGLCWLGIVLSTTAPPAIAEDACGVHCRNMQQMEKDNRRALQEQSRQQREAPHQDNYVDDAVATVFGQILKRGLQQQQQRESIIRERRATLSPQAFQRVVELGPSFSKDDGLMTFEGVAINRSGERTPIKVIVDEDHKEFGWFGRIGWSDFGSVHVVAGAAQGNRISFEEALVLKVGTHEASCAFDIFLSDGKGTGSFRCAKYSGIFHLRRFNQ